MSKSFFPPHVVVMKGAKPTSGTNMADKMATVYWPYIWSSKVIGSGTGYNIACSFTRDLNLGTTNICYCM